MTFNATSVKKVAGSDEVTPWFPWNIHQVDVPANHRGSLITPSIEY
jgi:hypothetical protein